jgi:hypothetical protein
MRASGQALRIDRSSGVFNSTSPIRRVAMSRMDAGGRCMIKMWGRLFALPRMDFYLYFRAVLLTHFETSVPQEKKI